MLMRAPRTRRISPSGKANKSAPAKVILPVVRACGGSSRIIASEVADLPEPDTPTSPSVPDSGIEKLTSRTAATTPVCVAKVTFRCSTWRREGNLNRIFRRKELSALIRSFRADLVRCYPRLNAFVHCRNKRRLFFQQRGSSGGKFAFHVQQSLGGKLLRQFQHFSPREIYVLAIIRMRHAYWRALARLGAQPEDAALQHLFHVLL